MLKEILNPCLFEKSLIDEGKHMYIFIYIHNTYACIYLVIM